jgi:hypothetical protein
MGQRCNYYLKTDCVLNNLKNLWLWKILWSLLGYFEWENKKLRNNKECIFFYDSLNVVMLMARVLQWMRHVQHRVDYVVLKWTHKNRPGEKLVKHPKHRQLWGIHEAYNRCNTFWKIN